MKTSERAHPNLLISLAHAIAAGTAKHGRFGGNRDTFMLSPFWFSRRKPPKVYDQPSFRDLMLKAENRDQMNDIMQTAVASNASPKTIKRIQKAYDQRLRELTVIAARQIASGGAL